MLAALIWGGAFVAQSVGMDYTGPYTFNVMRSFLGSLVLLPVIFFLDKKKSEEEKEREDKKVLIKGGICCGIILTISTTFQQI